jgi:hypothetical protein
MTTTTKAPQDPGALPASELTKREHFAAVAMQGAFANPNTDLGTAAAQAVRAADALVGALNPVPPPTVATAEPEKTEAKK